jgi:hypothetical protein
MVSHTLKLVILGRKLTSVKKIIAGGQTTVGCSFEQKPWSKMAKRLLGSNHVVVSASQ